MDEWNPRKLILQWIIAGYVAMNILLIVGIAISMIMLIVGAADPTQAKMFENAKMLFLMLAISEVVWLAIGLVIKESKFIYLN